MNSSEGEAPPSLWRQKWPEFRTSEGVATVASGLATLAIVLYGPSERPCWQGPILFDAAVRDSLRAGSADARQTYRTMPVLLHYSYADSSPSLSFVPDPKCGASCIGVRGTF